MLIAVLLVDATERMATTDYQRPPAVYAVRSRHCIHNYDGAHDPPPLPSHSAPTLVVHSLHVSVCAQHDQGAAAAMASPAQGGARMDDDDDGRNKGCSKGACLLKGRGHRQATAWFKGHMRTTACPLVWPTTSALSAAEVRGSCASRWW